MTTPRRVATKQATSGLEPVSTTGWMTTRQKSYFYMKNVAPQGDYVNLPAYVAGPPARRRSQWSYRARTLSPAGATAVPRLRVMIQSEGLTGADLLAAFVVRRVLPLQSRPHLICQMSGQFDPSRMCTKEMPHSEVALMVNYLANCKLTDEWQFGKEPYSRAHPPPMVSFLYLLFFTFVTKFFLADSDQSARLGRALSFDWRLAQRGRIANFSPTGRRTTWGRPPWTTTPRREAAKQAAPGLEPALTTGRTTTRRKSSRAASRRPTMARVHPPRHLFEAARRSAGPRRACSAVGRRSPRAGRRRPGGKRRPRRRPASARW